MYHLMVLGHVKQLKVQYSVRGTMQVHIIYFSAVNSNTLVLVKGVPAHDRGIESRWCLRSLLTLTILRFYGN